MTEFYKGQIVTIDPKWSKNWLVKGVRAVVTFVPTGTTKESPTIGMMTMESDSGGTSHLMFSPAFVVEDPMLASILQIQAANEP